MSITIGEVLENAEHNLGSTMQFQKDMGMEQLRNAIYLLNEKEKSVDDDFDENDVKDRK